MNRSGLHSLGFCLILLAALVDCSDQDDDQPYLAFAGGGFIFNYRLAQATYGFVAKVRRPIPAGTILEAAFEDPSGKSPLIVRRTARPGMVRYSFESPPLEGVTADRDYLVELRLIEPDDKQVIASYSRTFRSDLDQTALPDRPLTVGPGYQRNPNGS